MKSRSKRQGKISHGAGPHDGPELKEIIVIEMRRPKSRRGGEGLIHCFVTWSLLIILLGSAAWGGYEYGRWSMQPTIAALQSDLIVARGIAAIPKGRK